MAQVLGPDAGRRAGDLGHAISARMSRAAAVARARPQPKVSEYSYSVSLAIALCEGEIPRVGRVWADGDEISPR